MKTVVKSVVAVLAALAAFAHEARASGPYGSFVLSNPTRNIIHYHVQWGDGEWESHSVSPGYRRWHAYPLDGNGQASTPRVCFDYILNDGQVTPKFKFRTFHGRSAGLAVVLGRRLTG